MLAFEPGEPTIDVDFIKSAGTFVDATFVAFKAEDISPEGSQSSATELKFSDKFSLPKQASYTMVEDDIIVTSGLVHGTPSITTYKYNPKKQIALPISDETPALTQHSSIGKKSAVYIFGGKYSNNSFSNDFYIGLMSSGENPEISTTINWKKVKTTGNKPDPVLRPSLALMKSSLYVHGGTLADNSKATMLYRLDLETFIWYTLRISDISQTTQHSSFFIHNRKLHLVLLSNGVVDFFQLSDDELPIQVGNSLQISSNNEQIDGFAAHAPFLCLFLEKKISVFSVELEASNLHHKSDFSVQLRRKDPVFVLDSKLSLMIDAPKINSFKLPRLLVSAETIDPDTVHPAFSIFRKYPHILEHAWLRGRKIPEGIPAFKLFNRGAISSEQLLQLIYDFLGHSGLKSTLRTLINESQIDRIKFPSYPFHNKEQLGPILNSLLRLGFNTQLIFQPKAFAKEVPLFSSVDSFPPAALLAFHTPITWNFDKEKYMQDSNSLKFVSTSVLFEYLLNPWNYSVSFVSVFLSTFCAFTTKNELFSNLIQRFHIPSTFESKFDPPSEFKSYCSNLKSNILSTFLSWLQSSVSIDPIHQNILRGFVSTIINDPLFNVPAKSILQLLSSNTVVHPTSSKTIVENSSSVDEENEDSDLYENYPESKVPKNIFDPKIDIWLVVNPLEISRQLSLFAHSLMKDISAWDVTSYLFKLDVPHRSLTQYLRVCRRISDWVTWYLSSPKTQAERVLRFEAIYQVIFNSINLHDYSSAISLHSGLPQLNYPKQFKLTLSKVNRKILDQFEEISSIFQESSNYESYRNTQNSMTPPSVPYLLLYLQDVRPMQNFSGESPDIKTNWQKCIQSFNVFSLLTRYQAIPYQFLKIHQIQAAFDFEFEGVADVPKLSQNWEVEIDPKGK